MGTPLEQARRISASANPDDPANQHELGRQIHRQAEIGLHNSGEDGFTFHAEGLEAERFRRLRDQFRAGTSDTPS